MSLPSRFSAGSWWFLYVAFVVYGSLVPFDFHYIPLGRAWATFQQIQMFKLGVESRADWISNGVLYIPVGFLTAHLLIQKFSAARRAPLFFLAGLFSVALALGVEFTQIFFAPRTVSLNDLLAETVGIVIGLMLAARYSDWFKTLLQAIFNNPRRLALRLAQAYLAGYIAFSLFPYDILLSGLEIKQKLRGNNWGWLLAGDLHGRILIALKASSEIILTLPFGIFLGYRREHQPATFKQAAWFGFLLGSFIEIAQFFTASGVSQGLSVLTRIAGVCGGLALWQRRANWTPERLAVLIQRYSLPFGVLYLLILMQMNGWFSHPWKGADYAATKLADLHFLPFYYHYYTTEAIAIFSLASVSLMYMPIGLLAWSNRQSPTRAFFYALFAAGVVETSKLFLQSMRPDPTNVLLAAFAGWSMVHLASALAEAAITPSLAELTTPQARQSRIAMQSANSALIGGVPCSRWKNYALLLSSLAFAAYWAVTFPTQPALLFFFLTACAAIIWHRPIMLVGIIPAALPVLDLAPWSGRFYLDEFDLLLLISLAIGYTRIAPPAKKRLHADTLFVLASGMVALSFSISAIRGLIPWQTPDANAFTNYYSPFNALRIGKGAFWAFLSYGLLRRFVAAEIDINRPLVLGMVSGLTMTVAVILWERLTFASMFDFAGDYRVTGPFASMHTGGAYIECFLAVATPFLVLLILQTRSLAIKLGGVTLLLATTYALMVTFSRNGYLAFGIAAAIILFFALFKSGRWQQRSIRVLALSVAMLSISIPVFTGQFVKQRIASVETDYAVRQAHWADALNIRKPDGFTTLFGMGLGSYPKSHYLLSRESSHAGTYQLKSEAGNLFLRLGAGDPIYVEQIVSIEPNQNYVLKLSVRASTPDEKITVSLCEKWLLTSFKCVRTTVTAGNQAGAWSSVEAPLATATLGDTPWFASRQVKFALHNPADKSLIDISNVRLETEQGANLLLNGDFSKELDHWFFSADNHLQWHAKSLPVAVLFDQGWFGLIALCIFSILAIKRAAGRAWRGDLHAAAALAAFSGFLVVGLFDTLIDAPRFLFLFIFLGAFCGYKGRKQKNSNAGTDN